MAFDVDLVILGGGCAGLSLAWRLSGLGAECPSTLIAEQRATYVNDRTWCFWSNNDTKVEPLVLQQWQWLQLEAHGRSIRFDCGKVPYQMLASSDFYEHACQAIKGSSSVSLSLDTAVIAEPRKVSAGWAIETSQGTITARMVVDTRPDQAPKKGKAALWQSFYGHEVVCDIEVFDPACAVLMDFSVSTSRQIPFTYVLPISRHRAMIEATVFGPDPLCPMDLVAQLEAAKLKYVGDASFCVVRSESGILPMGLKKQPARPDSGYVKVGVMAGAARASSGFAFQRIQQWAENCSLAIAAGRGVVGQAKDPWVLRQMDHLFLKVIGTEAQIAPDLFLSIFDKADSASVIRFLSGRGTLKDYLQIIAALPAKHFVRQLLVPRFPQFSSNPAK
ncbi:MAG: hypothetical protein B7X59_06145 [Polaromonas sp. 39-63-203]|jgi:lycopene beta-cyclase|nr:MAG: hypothetical protein B7Y54_06685 [Polaromonas sp. 35-63-240]OYY97626.1 MAG: hypothetical protein B7Y42_07980 [Polaromonas sp. 28-63-22]OYZ83811.1 MAG: hypothetical protein B7Y03_07185 [Polaromonas sp. 24-62-144]OZA98432.1 MAG: hypothetical protein B7X59_06145 [Polaromonas sp. 39-63-203]